MRVAVVAPEHVPPTFGGAERLYEGLVEAIKTRSEHSAELVTLPSPEFSFAQVVDSYSRFHDLDLSDYDMVISTKYPSWMVRHRRHAVFMLHPLRGLYEGYGGPKKMPEPVPAEARVLLDLLDRTPHGTRGGAGRILDTARWVIERLGDDNPACAFPGPLIRDLVRWLDADAMHPHHIGTHGAISRTVVSRPDYFPPGTKPQALPCPTSLTGLEPGPFTSFFTASRLDGPKRIDLLIKAMSHVRADVQLRIAGTGPAEERLRAMAADDSRIVFLGRVDEEVLKHEYSSSLAVPFVPLDEDLGLVTLEAQAAHKAVICCTDSGGVTDLVEDGVSGFVVAPTAAAIGDALNKLASDTGLARRLGEAGAQSAQAVTWERVLAGIFREPDAVAPASALPRSDSASQRKSNAGSRRKVVVLSTYSASRARGGGQLRLNRLLRGLGTRFDVDLLALDFVSRPGRHQPHPGVHETVVRRSPAFVEREDALDELTPIPIDDIAASLFIGDCPEYLDRLRQSASDASGVIVEHPYLLPALRHTGIDLPLVYDSHNNESRMKRALLGKSGIGRTLASIVQEVESEAVRTASLVITCSTADRSTLEASTPTLATWELVPNGGDVIDTAFTMGADRERNRDRLLNRIGRNVGRDFNRAALFVGSYHPPNLEAAEAIVRVAAQLPEVAFFLVGSHGTHFNQWHLPANVLVTHGISNTALNVLLQSVDVGLNPMQSGGGTNLKLVEYFAHGIPVVSTELGVRGIEAQDGEHLLTVANDDLASAIGRVLADPRGAEQRAVNARRLAEKAYDWHVLGRTYTDAIAAAIDGTDW